MDRKWNIECNGKTIVANPYKYSIRQPNPVLWFDAAGRKFSVEFQNESDYAAANTGHQADILVISNNRSLRLPGLISNLKIQ